MGGWGLVFETPVQRPQTGVSKTRPQPPLADQAPREPSRSVPMRTRRDFVKSSLRGASLLAMAPSVPGFLAATARGADPQQDGRVLVVVQLDGGNDGVNTVVPLKDEGYAKHRKALRLDASKLLKLGDAAGLHPSLAGAAGLFERG